MALPAWGCAAGGSQAQLVRRALGHRRRGPEWQKAATRWFDKGRVVLPASRRSNGDGPFYVSLGDAVTARGVDAAQVRSAIRDRRKMRIAYLDEKNRRTRRTIWPLVMAYYVDVTLVGAWCELRKDFRNFRVERIAASRVLAARFQDHNGQLLAKWLALPKDRPVTKL